LRAADWQESGVAVDQLFILDGMPDPTHFFRRPQEQTGEDQVVLVVQRHVGSDGADVFDLDVDHGILLVCVVK
jgi:hypothetical protein